MRAAAKALAAMISVLVLLLASGWGGRLWHDVAVHGALIAVANVVLAAIGILALSAFLRSGDRRDLGLALAFLGFVAFYAWHGIYTEAEIAFQWLIYGPTARVAFGLGLLVMVLPLPSTRRRMTWVLAVFAGWLIATAGLGLLAPSVGAWSAGRSDLGVWRLALESTALALIIAAWATMRRAPWMNHTFEAGLAIIGAQSVYFVMADAWDWTWWVAHGMGAAGTVSLAAGVLLVARQNEAEELRDRMAVAAQMRQDFINQASHAIRTPLTTLAASLHSLRAEQGDTPRFEAMERAVQRLETLSGQMLRLAAEGPREYRRASVRGVVGGAVAAHREGHPDHDVRVELEEGEAFVDPGQLQAVVMHLLDNAWKYAPGRVDVCMEHTRKHVEIRVTDHGKGVPLGDRDLVFLPFAGYAEGQSAGFTLAWARRVVEAMDGTMTIEGDRGTSFVIRLPRMRPARHGRTSTGLEQKPMQQH